MNLKQQRAAALKAAQDIVNRAKAAGRDLTDAELAQVEAKVAEVQELDVKIAAQDAAVKARPDFVSQLSAGIDDAKDGHGRLDMSGLKDRMLAGMQTYSGRVSPGVKGLVPAGETVVTIPVVNTEPIPSSLAQERPPRLIDVLPASVKAAVYKVLKQTVIASPGTAGVVAPGDVKPTKKLGLHTEEARLRVIAVLSEPVDKYLLEDASNLRTWVGAELVDAILDALELEVLAGDGTGEHFTGLANTSGIQTQAFATDRITTLASGLSKVEDIGGAAFIALASTDWLAIQTARNSGGNFDLGGPIDASARTAWGTQVVTVPGLAAGDGYVVGNDSVEVTTDGAGIRVEWGMPGDTFTRNQVVARVEGRFNLDVTRPHRVVRLALTGA
ncbi:phage major capsid protein [Occultella gossypii]|uniref:Phage major capsid protein n=1 Tax=Occultella gossypii TaxID=2800820 RepID=A0ABS7S9J6_9MICO|nr:phage major capsid protein [Occultella gossypii]MBZ2195971.1 phage major capsid protein [Occultella gossypii]